MTDIPAMVPSQSSAITNRLVCPACGNDEDFFELANDVIQTSFFKQNRDGSFTHESDVSQINGDVLLFCGACEEDLTCYHKHFREMIF